MSDEADVQAAVDEAVDWLGGLDAVVHAAAVVTDRDIAVDDIELAEWQRTLAVNLTGTFRLAKYSARHLAPSHGRLVVVGSGGGVIKAHRSLAYAASKGGVHGLCLSLEGPLRRRGVQLVEVLPGAVDTPLVRRLNGDRAIEAAQKGELIPAAEVAEMVTFLVSPSAGAVRGPVRTW